MLAILIPMLFFLALSASELTEAADAERRARMVRDIGAMARETAAETGRPVLSERVMAAMNKVERHRFLPAQLDASAYANIPLPIGEGQTISQPYVVALMTDLLDPRPEHRVLEVGTGSGYQAAVLAELVGRVYSIEVVEPLGRRAAQRLQELGYRNVETRIGDGYHGWPEQAPFDAIVVTAAAPRIPQPLIDQLKPGGRMVIPVGGDYSVQQLLVLDKQADGRTLTRRTLPVRFVPLTRSAPR
jgi:protein-L-isoaspartate(D-aspartate) O-methyltransferase